MDSEAVGYFTNMAQHLIYLQPKHVESVVFTPEDEGNWMMAKLNVQVTDLAYAQIVEHLAKVIYYCCLR